MGNIRLTSLTCRRESAHSGYWKMIEPRCQNTMLSTDEEKAETLELTRGDCKEYQYFGLGVENETSRRLSTLLMRITSRLVQMRLKTPILVGKSESGYIHNMHPNRKAGLEAHGAGDVPSSDQELKWRIEHSTQGSRDSRRWWK